MVAIDAHTGDLATFDRDAGVDLVDAVTASTALPGLVPHDHHQRRALHQRRRALRRKRRPCLELYKRRGALAVRRTEPDTARGTVRGLRRPPQWGTDLEGQVEALRQQGSRVEVITPDAHCRIAMGTNQMNPATRIPAASAGYAQGTQEAARVSLL